MQLLHYVLLLCFRRDEEDLSQWQCEFRGQIRALRQWLKSMEMRLPPLDPRVCWVYCLPSVASLHFTLSLSTIRHVKVIRKLPVHVSHPILHLK